MSTLRELVRWLWWVIALLEVLAYGLAWVELRTKYQRSRERSFLYLSKMQLGDAKQALVTVIGLGLFGLNVQSNLLFLCVGLYVVIYRGINVAGWLLYVRGIINGGGIGALLVAQLRNILRLKEKSMDDSKQHPQNDKDNEDKDDQGKRQPDAPHDPEPADPLPTDPGDVPDPGRSGGGG